MWSTLNSQKSATTDHNCCIGLQNVEIFFLLACNIFNIDGYLLIYSDIPSLFGAPYSGIVVFSLDMILSCFFGSNYKSLHLLLY